ncbi:lipoprotein [Bordetella ansorpii]|uniref:Lipoprotein n=1 Tax=Bordetella ansorpii TaxID=288768 RepID=A0A157LVA1_9BORD|nr:tripartite tricarboxylate transporter substrate binding protein [Bordetella ansorpii]SAI00802.1 lipoprotein [Bordetella ansorpii]
MHKHLQRLSLLWMLALSAAGSHAGGFPDHPIRLLVGYGPGGGTDLIARLVATHVSQELGQPVVVENKPGAGGNIATDQVARSARDGYTLLLAANTVTINPHLYRNLATDIQRDVRGVGIIATSPIVLVAGPGSPFSTLDELLAYAKANPGKVSYGSPGVGTPQHLAVELLAHMSGLRMTHVPYKGSSQSLSDLLAGHIPLVSAAINSAQPYIESGKLRGLAVADAGRLDRLKAVPAIAERVKGYEVRIWYGLMAPANTPDAVVARLNQALAAAAKHPEMQARMQELGYELALGTPSAMDAEVAADVRKWGGVVKAAGLQAE